ncbi:M1 family aminopeptidase [Flavobacterium sp. J372]|uniref:M1 family aminopeptidase n=1 Tax=Flavobacterium sp. J372 TaxID=2898436 RepID=UPI0027E2410F|nr:M1 family aminopeptidase [Flavobacterium sp. J372]
MVISTRKAIWGYDATMTGIGMKFDYITIHETGHEWFGNSITSKDIADMWIHEGFTTYSESVFVECRFGYDEAMKYINGQRNSVSNDKPVIGIFGVNKHGSGDMYYKGALMLNTLRHIINDDAKWWAMILKYSETFRKKIIDTETVVEFFNKESGMNLTPVFNQYLRYKDIPVLELRMCKGLLCSRWKTDVKDFAMPVDVMVDGKQIRLYPTTTGWEEKFLKDVDSTDDVEVMTKKFFIKVEKT